MPAPFVQRKGREPKEARQQERGMCHRIVRVPLSSTTHPLSRWAGEG